MRTQTGKRRNKRGCGCPECFLELKILREEWIALRKHAHSLDLADGSYYDGRIGAINFWCGPENKPAGWPEEIPVGFFGYRRDYVGAVMVDGHTDRTITLHFEVVAYSRADALGEKKFSARYRKRLLGTKADQKWILKQFDLLRQHARLMEGL